VCALDAAAGHLLVGGWRDDEVRLALRTHLTALKPVELVLPRGEEGLGETSRRLLKCALRAPQVGGGGEGGGLVVGFVGAWLLVEWWRGEGEGGRRVEWCVGLEKG